MEDLMYPIGRFTFPDTLDPQQRAEHIATIAALPAELAAALQGLTPDQLLVPYRPGGWNIAQVVHHIADSGMNSYIRMKFAATEDTPTIMPYNEQAWAQHADATTTDLTHTLHLLTGLHARWAQFLASLSPEAHQRAFRHPDLGVVRIEQSLAMYAWHGRHHIAHITGLRARNAW